MLNNIVSLNKIYMYYFIVVKVDCVIEFKYFMWKFLIYTNSV